MSFGGFGTCFARGALGIVIMDELFGPVFEESAWISTPISFIKALFIYLDSFQHRYTLLDLIRPQCIDCLYLLACMA